MATGLASEGPYPPLDTSPTEVPSGPPATPSEAPRTPSDVDTDQSSADLSDEDDSHIGPGEPVEEADVVSGGRRRVGGRRVRGEAGGAGKRK